MAESLSEAGKALSANVAWNPLSGEVSINIVTGNVQVARDLCKTVTTLGEVTRDVCQTVTTLGEVTRDVTRDVCKTLTTLGGVARAVTRDLCITAVSLGALYVGYKLVKPLIETAVKRGLGGERDDQEVRGIRPGSLHVLLHCFTDERFLEVLADYESGRMKERLQEEFSQIGIKVEGLKVEIENMVEVNETKEAINKRYDRCFIKNITRAGCARFEFQIQDFQLGFYPISKHPRSQARWLSNTVESIRIVKMVKQLNTIRTRSVRTVKWLYGPYEPYSSVVKIISRIVNLLCRSVKCVNG